MNLYFDNAAALEYDPFLTERLAQLLPRCFSNQESPVSDTAGQVRAAEERLIAALLPERLGEQYSVLFVNTGTDAVNAVFSIFPSGSEVVLTGGEHASVRAAAERLAGEEKKLRLTGCDAGLVLPCHYREAVTEQTVLTAVHTVHPETGLIQRLPSKAERKNSYLLADAVQGIGKLPFDTASVQPDFLTVSGQKLGLPGGGAVLYKRQFRKNFEKLRRQDHRTGRVPPVFCVLLAETLERWNSLREERLNHAAALKSLFLTLMEEKCGGVFRRTVPDELSSPYIAHILLKNCQGAIVTRALSAKGIYAASGSACDSETKEPSAALRWMGIEPPLAYHALRISFSPRNDEAGICRLTDELAQILHDY